MEKNKKIILPLIRVTSFLLILILVLCSVSGVLSKKADTAKHKPHYSPAIMIGQEPANSIDILTFGNSDLWASFDPILLWKNYGFTSINGASSGQKIWESYFYLLKALETQSPKIIILETDMLYKAGGVERFVTNIEAAIASGVEINTPLIKNHNRWKSLFSQSDVTEKPKGEGRQTKGYNLAVVKAPYDGKEYMLPTDKRAKLPTVAKMFLDKFQKICQKKQIKLLLYETLTTNFWNTEKSNAVNDYAKRNKIDFIDFNLSETKAKASLDLKTDTRDSGVHLNHNGAEKVTKYLGEYLLAQNILTNHKSNAEYGKWNEAEALYNTVLAQKIEAYNNQNTK